MQDKSSESLSEGQAAQRYTYEAIQRLAETQFKILQRLADVQREQFSQALEAARDQLRLVSQVRDPREFASAQAHLVQGYGQQYMDRVNEAVSVISTAWEEYGDQLGKSMNTAANAARSAMDTTTRGAEEAADNATAKSTRKGASSKKST